MGLLTWIKPVYAHCDLPCGVYDPEQARIEARSVYEIQKRYDGLDEENKVRAIIIKEQRAELVKNHLSILWSDYFKPEHFKTYPDLHDLLWRTVKQASDCKHHSEPETGKKLLEMIDEVAEVFKKTQQSS